MSAYTKDFDKAKYMSDKRWQNENCNEIWGKFKNIIKKEFDSERVYNGKYLKAKIKLYNGKINTNFHNDKIPKGRS